MDKICRICWNTHDWRQPTGEAAKLEKGGTYVQTQGYGLEEWLFNFSWLHGGGLKYGYLQPIGKYHSKYQGTTLDIRAYARNPNGIPLKIADLRNATVLTFPEAAKAYAFMKKRGWVEEMQRDIEQLPYFKALPRKPEQIVNVKFDPDRVRFYDPPEPFPPSHNTFRNVRYQPLNWTDGISGRARNTKTGTRQSATDAKSEAEVFRKKIAATSYDPRHNKLQNALKAWLSKQHGKKSVQLEVNGVDVVLHTAGSKVFFEVKTHPTAKSCIRDAIGQLLEYAIYPNLKNADRLVIVGDGKPTDEDAQYLQCLRAHLPLPVHYSWWNWKTKRLDDEC
jgi:hypothetical protein